MRRDKLQIMPFPEGKRFAFTIVDDTDRATLETVRPVYDLLDELGLRTTKTVWVKNATHKAGPVEEDGEFDYGATLEDPEYREFVQSLHAKGFEIALHGVSGGNDTRNEIIEGYEEFKRVFGDYPKMYVCHSQSKHNLYWGARRLDSKILRTLMNLSGKGFFCGEDKDSPHFWGDICQQHTKYMRNWVVDKANILDVSTTLVYHDPRRPYVNFWYSGCNGADARKFVRLLSHKAVEKLVCDNGICVVYTHFGLGFTEEQGGARKVKEGPAAALREVASCTGGWFVPASEMLDRLLALKNVTCRSESNGWVVANVNPFPVEDLAGRCGEKASLFDSSGTEIKVDEQGFFTLGTLEPGSAMALFRRPPEQVKGLIVGDVLPARERRRLVFEWCKTKLSGS